VSEVWDEFKREESQCMPCCSPPSTTTWLIATSLARVKRKVQLAHTTWKMHNMAKTFKEIRVYGAPSFPREETSILGHGLSI
jgi:hypothetical protein